MLKSIKVVAVTLSTANGGFLLRQVLEIIQVARTGRYGKCRKFASPFLCTSVGVVDVLDKTATAVHKGGNGTAVGAQRNYVLNHSDKACRTNEYHVLLKGVYKGTVEVVVGGIDFLNTANGLVVDYFVCLDKALEGFFCASRVEPLATALALSSLALV